jgi:hypothetical protein
MCFVSRDTPTDNNLEKLELSLKVLISILTPKAVNLFPPAPRYVEHLLYVLFYFVRFTYFSPWLLRSRRLGPRAC